jgi:hypothetical protein
MAGPAYFSVVHDARDLNANHGQCNMKEKVFRVWPQFAIRVWKGKYSHFYPEQPPPW